MSLTGRVAIVTGAGRNIGEAIATTLAGQGANVAVVDQDGERADRVAAAIAASGPGRAMGIRADVTSGEQVAAMVARVVEHWGSVNILVNNVGVVDRKGILETPESEWDRIMAISLKSVYLCTKRVAETMVEAGLGGRIINIASTSAHQARIDATAYPAAKAAVLHLTTCLAAQLAPHGIRVNAVTPNRVLTAVGPNEVQRNWQIRNLIGRQITPQDVANSVAFLASDEAEAITGIELLVDGGALKVLPTVPNVAPA
jgi:NAD(P)-dependent dehydrogenase (short-subunit alcohol dehydrogenase family)